MYASVWFTDTQSILYAFAASDAEFDLYLLRLQKVLTPMLNKAS